MWGVEATDFRIENTTHLELKYVFLNTKHVA